MSYLSHEQEKGWQISTSSTQVAEMAKCSRPSQSAVFRSKSISSPEAYRHFFSVGSDSCDLLSIGVVSVSVMVVRMASKTLVVS